MHKYATHNLQKYRKYSKVYSNIQGAEKSFLEAANTGGVVYPISRFKISTKSGTNAKVLTKCFSIRRRRNDRVGYKYFRDPSVT